MTARAAFTQADVARALKGAKAAGVIVAVEIDVQKGTIRLVPVDAARELAKPLNPVEARRARRGEA